MTIKTVQSPIVRRVLISTFISLFLGCDGESNQDDLGSNRIDTLRGSSELVAAMAIDEVASRTGTKPKFLLATPRSNDDGTWTVLVTRLPKTPGDYYRVEFDSELRVTRFDGAGL